MWGAGSTDDGRARWERVIATLPRRAQAAEPVGEPTPARTARSWIRVAVVVFAVLRLATSLTAALAVNHGTPVDEVDPVARDMLGEPVLDTGVGGALLGPWQRQDALRYLRIAREGYVHDADSVFAPLYSLAIRATTAPFGGGATARMIMALVVSNAAAVAAFALLLTVVARHFGESTARRTLWSLALFPTAFFLIAPYTESMFLLAALATLTLSERNRPGWAGVAGALGALSRTTGWVLSVPLAWRAWTDRRQLAEAGRWALVRAWLGALGPLLALGGFQLFRQRQGFPSLSTVYRDHWLTDTSWPGKALVRALGWILTGGVPADYGTYFYVDVVATVLAIGACVWGWRRLPTGWWLYTVAVTLFILVPDSAERTLNSNGRYVLVLFPVFVMMASWPVAVRRCLALVAVPLAAAFVWSSATWYWVA